MSHDGGPGQGADDTTSFVLQPPRQPDARHPPQAPRVPHPDNPYAMPAQVASAPQEPGVGRLIAGRYRLLAKLGHGGMGTVWRAKDETVDREVAVKEPRVPDHLPERERSNAFERMRREARAAARLDHPSVVNVHDVAVVDGQPWIVMELVNGRSLGAALEEGTLGVREAARIGLEVLGALEAAHAAGILHRDVKPDNVLLGRHDRVVLTDFGIAQIEGETNLTDTGGFVGSPEFIAPERVLGQRPGPASDLWSLGVVLYAATEGVSPFRRSNTPATLQSVLNAAPAPPAAAQGPLAEAINGLLEKDPARRPRAPRVRALLEHAANPPAPAPTQVVTAPAAPAVDAPDPIGGWSVKASAGRAGWGLRVGTRLFWTGLGTTVVAAAIAAWLIVADPSTGGLPADWRTSAEKDVTATLAVPKDYVPGKPDRTSDDDHWVSFTDPSGAISIVLTVDRKAEDTGGDIKDSAAAEMYEDNDDFKTNGSYALDMPKAPRTAPDANAEYQGRPAAENTVVYTTDDTQNPRPREMRTLYYKSTAGDMYKLTISYPGKGDFTERGQEVARTAIAHLEVDKP
ncbi:serine/threonine protein kinase [Streptomyces phaeoluteigriseus]|uniref:non-specific serine/threonine protein kinase n=1 Tax=Streptomyces phaeoluteigriseus TaxID=114686 RepID=A0A1V6MJF8_9ACTN|nr:serine/threonine-protein kinase [Streptomyces phaeoluteigriseus]OQD52620.1 serine/threonine protein kinase [Streptomyces phaeoluteigriseus]